MTGPQASDDPTRRALVGDLALYAIAAAFAAANAVWARLWPHQRWGVWAAWACGTAAVVTAVAAVVADRRRVTALRGVIVAAALAVGVVAPLAVLSAERVTRAEGTAQSEVGVVEAMGDAVAHGRTPYPTAAAIDEEAARTGAGFKAYRPYEPLMAVFGVPRAWFGAHAWTDARVAFALVALTALWAAARTAALGGAGRIRAVQLLTLVPPTALTIATGGDDVPVIALSLLALAFASRRRWVACGLAMGVALAMKIIVGPLAVLLAVHVAVGARRRTDPATPSHRDLGRYLAGAVGLPVVAMVPFVLADPAAWYENVIRYPFGLARFHSSAASALPGRWLADHAPGGHLATFVLLGVVALGVLWWVARRPPQTAAQVSAVAAVALAAAIASLPATRFGYLMYPICLAGWARLLAGSRHGDADHDHDHEHEHEQIGA